MKIPDEALVAAAKLSERYINDRFLPDKAIDVIDEAGARARLAARRRRRRSPSSRSKLEGVNGEGGRDPRPEVREGRALRDKERELQGEIRQQQDEWEKRRQSHPRRARRGGDRVHRRAAGRASP